MKSRLVSRNIIAGAGRTSMRLEPELWAALGEICAREAITLPELIGQAERLAPGGSRTSAVRTFAMAYFRAAARAKTPRARAHSATGAAVTGSGLPPAA